MKLMLSLVVAAVFALPSYAVVDPPVAWSNETVTLEASIPGWPYACEPDQVTAALTDQTIVITVVAPHAPQCSLGPPTVKTLIVTAAVGPLAPGIYQVRRKLVTGAIVQESFVRTLYVRDAAVPF
ncbi:MAG: hypothetical protein QOH21_2100, partial [Acidobacteriota bacterium]|nr:hypothetical protein [Acidobacteriota bacterium]